MIKVLVNMLSRVESLEVDLPKQNIGKVKDLSNYLRAHYDTKGRFECFLETQKLAEDEVISTSDLESKVLFCALIHAQEAAEVDEKRSLTAQLPSITASESGVTFRIKNMFCGCLQRPGQKSLLSMHREPQTNDNSTEFNGHKEFQRFVATVNSRGIMPLQPNNCSNFSDKESLASVDLGKRVSRDYFNYMNAQAFIPMTYGRSLPNLWPQMIPWMPWPIIHPQDSHTVTLPRAVPPAPQSKKVKEKLVTAEKKQANQKPKLVQANANRNPNTNNHSRSKNGGYENKANQLSMPLEEEPLNDWSSNMGSDKASFNPINIQHRPNEALPKIKANEYIFRSPAKQQSNRPLGDVPAKSRDHKERGRSFKDRPYQAEKDQKPHDMRNCKKDNSFSFCEKNDRKDYKDTQSDKQRERNESADQNKPNKEKATNRKSKIETIPVNIFSPKRSKAKVDIIGSAAKSPKRPNAERSPVSSSVENKLSASKPQNAKPGIGISPKKASDSSITKLSSLVKQRIRNAVYEKVDLENAIRMVPVAKRILLQNKPAKFRLRNIEDGIPTISKEIFGRIRHVNLDNIATVDLIDSDEVKDINLESFFQLAIVKNPYQDFFKEPGQNSLDLLSKEIKEFPYKPLKKFSCKPVSPAKNKGEQKKQSRASRNYSNDSTCKDRRRKESPPEQRKMNPFDFKVAKTINKLFGDNQYFDQKIYKLVSGSDKGIDVSLLTTISAVRSLTGNSQLVWQSLKDYNKRHSCKFELLKPMRIRKKD